MKELLWVKVQAGFRADVKKPPLGRGGSDGSLYVIRMEPQSRSMDEHACAPRFNHGRKVPTEGGDTIGLQDTSSDTPHIESFGLAGLRYLTRAVLAGTEYRALMALTSSEGLIARSLVTLQIASAPGVIAPNRQGRFQKLDG
jgi:hypothetical protein